MHDDSNIEADDLARVPFGRNRLAHALGTSLFGSVAAALMRSAPAEASHVSIQRCSGTFPRCHNCFNETCVSSGCTAYSAQCPSGSNCWVNCYRGLLYRCCDWRERYSGGTRACTCYSGSLGICG